MSHNLKPLNSQGSSSETLLRISNNQVSAQLFLCNAGSLCCDVAHLLRASASPKSNCLLFLLCRGLSWVGSFVVPGLGMFCEAYYIFSVGNVKPVWEAQYPECWLVSTSLFKGHS